MASISDGTLKLILYISSNGLTKKLFLRSTCDYLQTELFTYILQLARFNLDMSGWANFAHVTYAWPRRSSVHLFIPTDYNSATSDVHLIRYSDSGIIKTFVAKPRVLMLCAHTHTLINEIKCVTKIREREKTLSYYSGRIYMLYTYIT